MTNMGDNEQSTFEYFKNLAFEIKNTNLDEEKAGKILSFLYDIAINGIPHLSDSIDKLVDDYTKKYSSKEVAIKELINYQIIK